jgi:signal transduction histidine kinase
LKKVSNGLRAGHVFLDTRRKRLQCLNETARQLHREGLPLTPTDLPRGSLRTLSGQAVTANDLPLVVAWRTQASAEARFRWQRDGGVTWEVTWAATPLLEADEQLLGVVGSVVCQPPQPDIRSMAELAHDLRTPLQSLRLLCSLVERMPKADDELRQALETMRVAADRAVQVGLQLLDCCRGPVAQPRKDSREWFAMQPFLVGLAGEQAALAQGKGLSLTTDFTPVAGMEILSDPVRLGRILSNLLVNAIRYTPLGRVEFRAAWRQEPGHRQLELSVVDTGPGISQEEQESIFQPFERGRAGRDSDSGGSGLGLAVVERLVEELQLTLDVYSEFGRGSAFHLVVPENLVRAVPDSAALETLPNA